MADLTRPEYGEAWASQGEKLAPVQDKMELGWVQEMMPFQYENFLQGRQDDALLYLLQKGIPEYSATQEYIAQKSVVLYTGSVYLAIQTVTGVLPTVTASWKRLSASTDASGVITIAGGGTGATTAAGARTNLELGTAATLDAANVVQKDVNGDFSANIITATLNGKAATADKLTTARMVSLSGGATTSPTSWDGGNNLDLVVTTLNADVLTTGTVPASALGNVVARTSATGAALLPNGTTAQRDTTPALFSLRGNTTTGLVEYYNGTDWVISTAQSLSYVLNRGNHTGTQPASTITGLSVGATFITVPTTFQGLSIVVTTPHTRFMIWNGSAYVRAPWHLPAEIKYSYADSLPGALPVRGDVVYNKDDYPDLVSAMGLTPGGSFSLVEARGEFLRVLDNGRGIDVGRAIRSWQGDAGRAITGTVAAVYRASAVPATGALSLTTYGNTPAQAGVIGASSGDNATISFNSANSLPGNTASEFRPRNIAFPLWVTY